MARPKFTNECGHSQTHKSVQLVTDGLYTYWPLIILYWRWLLVSKSVLFVLHHSQLALTFMTHKILLQLPQVWPYINVQYQYVFWSVRSTVNKTSLYVWMFKISWIRVPFKVLQHFMLWAQRDVHKCECTYFDWLLSTTKNYHFLLVYGVLFLLHQAIIFLCQKEILRYQGHRAPPHLWSEQGQCVEYSAKEFWKGL